MTIENVIVTQETANITVTQEQPVNVTVTPPEAITIEVATEGLQGAAGPANQLELGTVETGSPGSSAEVLIEGDTPSQTISFVIPRGNTGDTGPQGETGPPNVLSVGSVNTGAAGTGVIVDLVGTSPSQTISFTIPRGDQGIQGIEGPQGIQGIQGIQGPVGPAGLTWRNTWDAGTDYVKDDAVYWNFSSWFASIDPPLGDEPSDASAYWYPLAARGAQGIQGIQGPQGEQGPQGLPGTGNVNSVNGFFGPDVVLDSASVGAVALTGNETIAGAKTFSSTLVGTAGGYFQKDDLGAGGWLAPVIARNDTGQPSVGFVKAGVVGSQIRVANDGNFYLRNDDDTDFRGLLAGSVTATSFIGPGASITGVLHTTGDETATGVKTFHNDHASLAPIVIRNDTGWPGIRFVKSAVTSYLDVDATGDFWFDTNGGTGVPRLHTGDILLMGGSLVNLAASGSQAPTFTTRSGGTKVVLWEALGAAATDAAIGIGPNALWNSVPSNTWDHKWYAGTTVISTLTGAGNLSTAGTITAGGTGFSGSGANITGVVHTAGNETIAGAKTFTSLVSVNIGGLTGVLGANDLTFNRPAASSYITQNGIGGSLVFITSGAVGGDTTSLTLSATAATFASGKPVFLGPSTINGGLPASPWQLAVTGGNANDGTAVRVGGTGSYPNYIGSLFGTSTYSGMGTVMTDNGLQLTNIGGEFRVQTSATGTTKNVAYASKSDANKEFVFTTPDTDLWATPPGSTFTVSGVTYTVRSARNTGLRVVEDIAATPASGTLTGVLYAPVRMSISAAGGTTFYTNTTIVGTITGGRTVAQNNNVGTSFSTSALEARNDTGNPSIAFHKSGSFAPQIRAISTGMFEFADQAGTALVSISANQVHGATGVFDSGNRVVSTAGDQTINGAKNFNSFVRGPAFSFESIADTFPATVLGASGTGVAPNYGIGSVLFDDGNGTAGTNATLAGYFGLSLVTGAAERLRIDRYGAIKVRSGSISMTNATSNTLDFSTYGVGAPTFNSRSIGTKISLYKGGSELGASTTEYAIGIEGSTLWQSIPQAISAHKFKWYAGITNVMTLDGTGSLLAEGTITTNSLFYGKGMHLTNAGNVQVEIGRVDGTASTPYIDFHSGATLVDYDTRIMASGGNGTLGGGVLTITAQGGLVLNGGFSASGPVTTNVTTNSLNTQRFIFTTAGQARPTGTAYVEWVGPVQPTNAIDGDTWVNTA